MKTKKLPEDFGYLPEMYSDDYFPDFLVDKLREIITQTVSFIEDGTHSIGEIQESLDQMTQKINELQDEFENNDSEIETVARDSIGMTIDQDGLYRHQQTCCKNRCYHLHVQQ